MKISILQTHLLSTLTSVGRIISSKAQLPILQNVLLETKGNIFIVAGTNTETSIVSKSNAKIEKEGGACVPAKLLIEFITSLPEGTVEMNVKDGALCISSSGFEATIPCVSKEEFPTLPKQDKTKGAELPKDVFIKALESVLFAAATDEGRPILTGVKIQKSEEDTLFVATDGYRLSLKRVDLTMSENVNRTIPARTLSEVVRVGEGNTEDKIIEIKNIDEAQLGFFLGDTEIYTRVLDGEYPNFEKILPKKNTTKIILDKEKFLQAVKSASIFARDNANIIKFIISEGEITISANTPQIGQNKVTLDGEVDGEGGEIAFNSRFVLDFLSHFQEEKLQFEMTGSLNPGTFKSTTDDSYLHIIMPVRTTS
jgi:DNA polymerase-3 subunit beta